MRYYFAPMEGITCYPLRNVHHSVFGDSIDKYYTPFLTAHSNHHFKKREKKDALPEHAVGFEDYGAQIVPQIMAGKAEDFIWAAREMAALGYKEVNLNLGCPAATVTNSHKGAGLLTDTDYLTQLLDGIFEAYAADSDLQHSVDISLKTRLGFTDENEAATLMKIYAAYPVKELTIHARVREDFYKGTPRIEAFDRAVTTYREAGGKADICYNGDAQTFKPERDDVSAIMIGRALLTDPALVRVLKGGQALTAPELKEYLTRLYEGYSEYIPEERNVIFKLLEHWAFLHVHFKDCDKYLKAIRKSRAKGEYMAAVNNIFASCEFI